MASTNLTIRIDSALKTNAETLFEELGMSLSTAFTVFLRQALRTKSIPFSITCEGAVPNRATVCAMREAERVAADVKVKSYSTCEELAKALGE